MSTAVCIIIKALGIIRVFLGNQDEELCLCFLMLHDTNLPLGSVMGFKDEAFCAAKKERRWKKRTVAWLRLTQVVLMMNTKWISTQKLQHNLNILLYAYIYPTHNIIPI